MFRYGKTALAAAATAGVLALSACANHVAGGSSSGSGGGPVAGLPTVTLMVGGIDKQIYLPYQLAQGLGYYKKYGVNVTLSTETQGGTGAEEAMASGQVDMAGAWYTHTLDFQQKGKSVEDIVNLSGAPGERIMCAAGTNITSPAQWKGKTIGVTDLGSGTDQLTQYLAARYHLTTKDFHRAGVGDGSTFISALKQHTIDCGMTTQPTVATVEKMGIGHSAFDLATTAGVKKWLGGPVPTAGVLAQTSWVSAHKPEAQKVVDALVATMHYIHTHSAADIADHLPASYTSNSTVTKADYIKALTQDKGQFLPDGMMPADGPKTAEAIGRVDGSIKGPVSLPPTYTNSFAQAANKLEGYSK
ncbi:MAG: ABC transporter substrate-binding protein [Streptosporangiales bacterium]|nr:ABC transporter substrate-binding protein [Streptosporangiales bacterium]